MATGLTTAIAALAVASVLWLWWRARAEAARREEIRRALETISEDGAGLLAAINISLDTHRRATGSTDVDLETARLSARALARLVDGAQAYVRDPHGQVERAEGLVRVGIAIARSRGRRVLLRGEGTELRTRGDAQTTCHAMTAIIGALTPATSRTQTQDFVEITLERDGLRLVGKAATVDREVQGLLDACGWSLRGDGGSAWYLAAGAEPPPPPADEHAHAREHAVTR